MRQNVGPNLALTGFKRAISVIKYQELMPDPFDFTVRQNVGPNLALTGFKRAISVIKYQELMPDPFDFILSPLHHAGVDEVFEEVGGSGGT